MRRGWLLLLAILALPGLVGCEREGPAERAGKKIDHAANNVKDAAKEAADEMKDEKN